MFGVNEKILVLFNGEKEQDDGLFQSNDTSNDGSVNKCYQCIFYPHMLFPRRKNLVEKLWSLAKADPKLDAQTNQYGRQQRQQQLQLRNGQRAIDTDTAVFGPMTAKNLDYQWTSNAFQHLQDKLTKVQLESLLKCIKRWETPEVSQPSDCILVSRNNQHLDFDNNLNTIACKIWRWPDLTATDGLRHIPSCTDSDQAYICCNPYHWSRVIDPSKYRFNPVYHLTTVY